MSESVTCDTVAELARALHHEGILQPVDVVMACPDITKAHSIVGEIFPETPSVEHVRLFTAAVQASWHIAPGWASTHVHLTLRDDQRRVKPKSSTSVPRPSVYLPTASQIQKATARLAKSVLKVPQHSSAIVVATPDGLSLKDDLSREWDTVIQNCFALLEALLSGGKNYSQVHIHQRPIWRCRLIPFEWDAMLLPRLMDIEKRCCCCMIGSKVLVMISIA